MANDTTLLVATVKNEGPNILEWVAHHRLCGFDRIQIYQNDSTDTTVQVLRTLDRIGVIEFHENRHSSGAHQVRAYRRASRTEAYRNSSWCMTLDGDEFLNVTTGSKTVKSLIEVSPERADVILVNWRVFGSAGKSDFSDKLVTERFVRAEAAEAVKDAVLTPFKSLFRTETFGRPGIHLPRKLRSETPLVCNASGLVEGEFYRKNWRAYDPGGRKFAQVNHYMLRDLSSFLLKHLRGSANAPKRNVDRSYWRKYDRNEEEDLSLASRAFEVWAEMKRLDELADGRLLRLRHRGLRQWRMALQNLSDHQPLQSLRQSILDHRAKAPTELATKPPTPDQPVFTSVRSRSEHGKRDEMNRVTA